MNIDDFSTSRFLNASSFGDVGTKVRVTVGAVEAATIGRETKPVMFFVGKQKGLTLNVANQKAMKRICNTSDTDRWVGTAIDLQVELVDFKGDAVPGLRIHPVAPAAAETARIHPVAPSAPETAVSLAVAPRPGAAAARQTTTLEDDAIPF